MFQIDSKIVRSVYATEPNYIIDYDESSEENVCTIYFSSNDQIRKKYLESVSWRRISLNGIILVSKLANISLLEMFASSGI